MYATVDSQCLEYLGNITLENGQIFVKQNKNSDFFFNSDFIMRHFDSNDLKSYLTTKDVASPGCPAIPKYPCP